MKEKELIVPIDADVEPLVEVFYGDNNIKAEVDININFDDYNSVYNTIKCHERKLGSERTLILEDCIWEKYLAIKILEQLPYYNDMPEIEETRKNILDKDIDAIMFNDAHADLFSIANYLRYEQGQQVKITFNYIPGLRKEFRKMYAYLLTLLTDMEYVNKDGKKISILITPVPLLEMNKIEKV